MPQITFNYRNYLGETLENAVCKVKPQQPLTGSGVVKLNSPLYVEDEEVINLPAGIYIVTISGDSTKLVGYLNITSGTPDSNLSEIIQLVSDVASIPTGTPISAISGLQSELDSKLPRNDPSLNNLLTTQERSKLAGIQLGATANQPDSFLLNRSNHTGSQPINTVENLETNLSTINSNITNLTARNEFTSVEKSKLAGIQSNATQNLSNSLLLDRANHTGTQPQNTINGLTTRLDSLDLSISGLVAREIFTLAEKNKLAGIASGATLNSTDAQLRDRSTHTGTQPISSVSGLQSQLDSKLNTNSRLVALSTEPNPATTKTVQLASDGSIVFSDSVAGGVTAFNSRTGNITPQESDYSAFFIRPNTSPTLNSLDITNILNVDASGSSELNPRTIGVNNLTTGTAARFQFGDNQNAIQSSFGGKMQIYSWHGLEFVGAHAGNAPTFLPGNGASDVNVNIRAMFPSHRLLALSGSATQSVDMLQVYRGGTLCSTITSEGLWRNNRVFTSATLPIATSNRGALAYKTDGISRLAVSDGTSWLELPDATWSRDRANHTGTQSISTITNLQTELDSKLTVTGTPTTNQVPVFNGTSVVWTNQTGGMVGETYTLAEKNKLAGIQPNATANQLDSFLLDRTNHTGTQSISSVSGLQTSLDSKPDSNSSASFTNLNLTGQITVQNAGSNNRPVNLSTYSISAGNEEGLSVEMLRVNKGRLDFNPLDDKAEIRVTGNNTALGIYNTSTNSFYLQVSSLGDLTVTRDLAARDIRATRSLITNSEFYAPIVTSLGADGNGSIRFTNIPNSAIGIRNGSNWITVPSTQWVQDQISGLPGGGATDSFLLDRANHTGTQATSTITGLDTQLTNLTNLRAYHYVSSSVPGNPAVAERWLEVAANGTPIAEWFWSGTRWLSVSTYQSVWFGNAINATTTVRIPFTFPEFRTGIVITRVQMIAASGTNHTAANFYTGSWRGFGAVGGGGIGLTDFNTQTLVANTNSMYATTPNLEISTQLNGNTAFELTLTRTGTPAATFFNACITYRQFR